VSNIVTFTPDRVALPDGAALSCPSFDYDQLDAGLAADAREAAERIRTRLNHSLIETGNDLLAIKHRLGYAVFGRWLKTEFGMTERSAERYINSANLVTESDKLSELPHQTIYALACAPKAVRDSLIQRIDNDSSLRAVELLDTISSSFSLSLASLASRLRKRGVA
jgi:hypothetical protein